MSNKFGTVWDLDPHTAKKHEILRRYFEAWLPIMSRYSSQVLYVDGFAGPGEYSNCEDGSPLQVLKSAIEHRYKSDAELACLFVEADSERHAHLNVVLERINQGFPVVSNFRWFVVCLTNK
jgi:three-Cys-motif partner protein